MRGLYAIVDADAVLRAGFSVGAFAEAVLAARPAAIQLRDKRGGARATLEHLRTIAPMAARAGVPLFANDRPDLAVLARCDGVHVGQDDLPIAAARQIAPNLRVGVSTHDEAQVAAAIAERPDYIAVGPIFATASKANPDPIVGLDRLRAIAATIRAALPQTPIVAIGGIDATTAKDVLAIADAVAVIGALTNAASLDEVASRARTLGRNE